jgi:HAD superfamily hydrolase (TIGR01490 family)
VSAEADPAAPPAPGPGPAPGRAAAFFDLDRTLIAGSSAFQFGRAAARAGMIGRRDLVNWAVQNVVFRLRGSTDEGTDAARDEITRLIRGVEVKRMRRLAPGVLAGVLPLLYPQMLEIAYAHQDAGRPVYIVTAASQEMADLIAAVLAFDGALGFRSEIVDGRYTGRPQGPFTYREGKAVVVRELAEREGIDLAASYAYSDSESDLPLLRLVGHPVAVNPDGPLLAEARAQGWDILRFDRLPKRLRLAGAAMAAAAVGGSGAAVLLRRGGRGRNRVPLRA